jgi:hypothetical protein
MATYNVTVMVEYSYEVEADNDEAAEAEGWKYEDYGYTAQVDGITVDKMDDEEDEE